MVSRRLGLGDRVSSDVAAHLIELCRAAGDSTQRLAMAGEGNASAVTESGTVLVTASGARLARVDCGDIVEIRPQTLLDALSAASAGDARWLAALEASRVEPGAPRPTVEAALHAILAAEFDAHFVLHTHPTAVLSVLCSPIALAFAEQRRYPDEVVLTGPASCLVPYVDPGRSLALAVRAAVREFSGKHRCRPRIILMENHGMIAVGDSWTAAFEATLMTDKAARITIAAAALGGVRSLSSAEARRIDGREDEHYRRTLLT